MEALGLEGQKGQEGADYAFGIGGALLERAGLPQLQMKEQFPLDAPPVPPGQLWLLLRDGQSQFALLSPRYSFSVFEPRKEHRHHATLGTHKARTYIAPGEVHRRTHQVKRSLHNMHT